MAHPPDLPLTESARAICTARAMLGDDWATALAIATNQTTHYWERIANGFAEAPETVVEAVAYADQVMLSVEALALDTRRATPKKIAPHPDQEVQRIAIAILAEIAVDIKPL